MVDGQALREARATAGLTQRQLAERSGCSQKTISHIEVGRPGVQTRRATVISIARALGLRERDLMSDEEAAA